jgi:Holliday junction resolvase
MATTPEGKVKAVLCKLLDAYSPDVYYFKPAANGYGRAGIPDVIVCCNGRMIAVECKTRGNNPTPLQQRELTHIEAAGGITVVLNEDNIAVMHVLLHSLKARRPI